MLTTLTKIKARLKLETADVVDDALLTNFLNLVSNRFDSECRRTFARGAAITEEFDGDATELRVMRYPLEAVAGFDLKTSETAGWVAQVFTDYVIRHSAVVSLASPLGTWRDRLRVTYTGGYVLPGTTVGAGQTALPDEVEMACLEQTVAWWRDRDRLGLSSVSGAGGSVSALPQSVVKQIDLLPLVQNVLLTYRRFNG